VDVHNLSDHSSIASVFLSEIRDETIQKDRLRFRKNLSRLGEVLAYEMSKSLDYTTSTVSTPLSNIAQPALCDQPVLISIMRAGIPFFEGVQNFFDRADCGFVGAFRASDFVQTQLIETNYFAIPDLTNKTLIIADPMLATGKSVVTTLDQLEQFGFPKRIFMLSVIAAPEGIERIRSSIKIPVHLWTAAVDEKLNAHAYIIPGLGDAGDLAYGPKQ